ncbi:MAG: HD domain-containing phosphohydrolase [Mariprofundaceae bacterium]
MRRRIHYALSMVIIPFYGIQVCPFVESLSPFWVAFPIAFLFAIQYLIGIPLSRCLIRQQPLEKQVRYVFTLEMVLFITTGILLMIFNTVTFDFPLPSGMKLIVGIVGFGLFAAIDLALEAERQVANQVMVDGTNMDPEKGYLSIGSKMIFFSCASLLLMVAIFTLLVIKDLDWLVQVGDSITLSDGRASILKEFLFVLIVILPHTLNIILSYTRNIRTAFDAQNNFLTQVNQGDYSSYIPVSSADEFGMMARHGNQVMKTIRDRTDELQRTRDITILSLATLAETRDNETGAHILRTQRYVRALAMVLKDHPKFAKYLDDETIDLLFKSAPLHDIGKVGIPDAILLKPGKLTGEEFEIMKTHAQLGADALAVAERELGRNSFLVIAQEISLSHHEKWDGSGYPLGLSGESIPFSGRLMAVADVYDALISKRVYKPAFSHERAREIIIEGSNHHFDPDIVDAFVAAEQEFCDIAKQYGDASI